MHSDNTPVPYGSKLHIPPTNYHLLVASLYEKYWRMFWKKGQEKLQQERRRDKTGKRNQMTALSCHCPNRNAKASV